MRLVLIMIKIAQGSAKNKFYFRQFVRTISCRCHANIHGNADGVYFAPNGMHFVHTSRNRIRFDDPSRRPGLPTRASVARVVDDSVCSGQRTSGVWLAIAAGKGFQQQEQGLAKDAARANRRSRLPVAPVAVTPIHDYGNFSGMQRWHAVANPASH